MEVQSFDAIRISLASPEQIKEWSCGEVTKPETINYRTLRPERDGLFCERIFGPTRDWECACGKYKRVRYKGIVCDKCGVEVAPSRVRRERMGHIELASPVSHIWYVKGVPSRLGLLLNISPRHLERVLYFAQYIVTNVNEDARSRAIQRAERDTAQRMAKVDAEYAERAGNPEEKMQAELEALDAEEVEALAALDERINAQSSRIISEAQELQLWIDSHVGKKATEAKRLNWVDEPIVKAGQTVSKDYVGTVNDLLEQEINRLGSQSNAEKDEIREQIKAKRDFVHASTGSDVEEMRGEAEVRKDKIREEMERFIVDLKGLEEQQLLTETRYRELADRWNNVFQAGMGAEAIRDIVAKIDLDKMAKELRREIRTTKSKQRRKKAAKRLRVVESFRKSGNRPEWMVMTSLPVIPPDLRPMVQLDGGRFATSDLNDLYRRVINRNNRLQRLMELGAPDVIVRNEKRMLQEAVDSLIDNGRRGRAVSRSGKRKLKSLSDLLKGKQGRFRRNLLGKRVDYSGRSVIVIGPTLKLHQCGLPKKMALELFKPFVMRRLVENNFAHNIKSAKRMVDRSTAEVWDVLEEICKQRPVLLNRAPTLHRLGIQAFEVVLIEGSAIQLHPLTCAAFNADFDGDQMAVHVPLSDMAVEEARNLMLASRNLLKPSSGDPIVGPSKDMVMGVYYLTVEEPAKDPEKLPTFASMDDAEYAYSQQAIKLRQPINVLFRSHFDEMPVSELGVGERVQAALEHNGVHTVGQLMDHYAQGETRMVQDLTHFGTVAMDETREAMREMGLLGAEWPKERLMRTTVGRVIFNRKLPQELWFINETLDRKGVDAIVGRCYKHLGREKTAELVDNIKDVGFTFATRSGITIAVSDIRVPAAKAEIIEKTSAEVEKAEHQFRRGLITEDELYSKRVELWQRATDDVTEEVKDLLDPTEGLGAMAKSGATKGGINPIRQLAGMRGLMADPNGRIIAMPIRSNFREGLTALEYFLSTHGARKGLADTALRTADAGYLTRRLVDVAQDVIITKDDCGTHSGIWIYEEEAKEMGETFLERIAGRYLAADVLNPETGELVLPRDAILNESNMSAVQRAKVTQAFVRSPISCDSRFGICTKCYGEDLARGGPVDEGEAVGIIAAQSIGEPGTQLTLRTFHTGGVAGGDDITQGLPRIEELFEARNPKGEAVIAEIDGAVDERWEGDTRFLDVRRVDLKRREVDVPAGYELVVVDDDRVQSDTVVARRAGSNGDDEELLMAGMDGNVYVEKHEDGSAQVIVRHEETDAREYQIPANARLMVEKGQEVTAGTQLTVGAKNPKEILRIEGREKAQLYLLGEVQRVYRSQGVSIHDKHIEVILRQLFRRVIITGTGTTDFLPGELIDLFYFDEMNDMAIAKGGKPARAEAVVLGLTKAALNTESFLAAASFQETTRVLTEAAIKGQKDDLRGLKENVIIGKLIPVGTGFLKRRQEALEAEKRAELEAHVDNESGEIEMEVSDLDLSDEYGDLTGVAELGTEPMGVNVTVSSSSGDDDSDDVDIETLEEDEEEGDSRDDDSNDQDDEFDIDVEVD
jgi:DNA-directed RNA polymerase subunit beta'